MGDSGQNNGGRRSQPVHAPTPSRAPLGHLPLVLAWVQEQEAKRPSPTQGVARGPADVFELEIPDDTDDFDLPIPGMHAEAALPAPTRHVVPPPSSARDSTSARPLESVRERASIAPSFSHPVTQRHSIPNSKAPAPRPSLTPARGSQAPARGSQAPATSRSLAPNRPSTAPIDDPRWVFGRALLSGGRKGEALLKLEDLYYAQPEHEPCRVALLELYLEMRNTFNVKEHADWVVLRHLQADRASQACDTYRRVRTACPDVDWSERTLALLTVAGDRLRDAQVVADATKLLLQAFPASSFLPRALFATANCQLDNGRPDLARTTLQHLMRAFPMDSVATLAAQKLRELGT